LDRAGAQHMMGPQVSLRAIPHPWNESTGTRFRPILMIRILPLLLLLLPVVAWADHGPACGATGVALQVLGSGGPELRQGRASNGFLIWIDGKARILINSGGGVPARFVESGANFDDLNLILFTDLRSDFTAGFPALIRATRRSKRSSPLPIYGPQGRGMMSSTITFVRTLFDDKRGAWRSLGALINPLARDTYKLQPHDIRLRLRRGQPRLLDGKKVNPVFRNKRFQVSAAPVMHDGTPALAWRINTSSGSLVFGSDVTGVHGVLPTFASSASLLVVSHAVAENAPIAAKQRYMPPSTIGRIAGNAKARELILTDRRYGTLDHERESLQVIRRFYAGPVRFANDLSCYALPSANSPTTGPGKVPASK
jgi:ribonuclease BN (tRNA processing enzyme)